MSSEVYGSGLEPAELDIIIPRGGVLDHIMTYKVDNVPVDITGWTVHSTIKYRYSDSTPAASPVGTVLSGPGEFSLYLPASTLNNLKQSEYLYDIWLLPPGDDAILIAKGKMKFVQSVSYPVV